MAAHRVVQKGNTTALVMRATYVHPTLRGSGLVQLLSGYAACRTWLRAPFQRLFMCKRTRNPVGYAAVSRLVDIYPKLDDPQANRKVGTELASDLVSMVYGEQALRTAAMRKGRNLLLRFSRTRQAHA